MLAALTHAEPTEARAVPDRLLAGADSLARIEQAACLMSTRLAGQDKTLETA